MRVKLIAISLLVLFISSCDSSTKEDPKGDEITDILKSADSRVIHGTEIGDEMDHVITRMKPHIVSEMPDEITARIPLNMKDSTFYDIDYDFKNGKLYSIDLDIYPKSNEDCKILFQDFRKYYNSAFGKGQEKDEFIVWYTSSKTGDDVEIIMMDESSSHGKPYLAITFYQEEHISK